MSGKGTEIKRVDLYQFKSVVQVSCQQYLWAKLFMVCVFMNHIADV